MAKYEVKVRLGEHAFPDLVKVVEIDEAEPLVEDAIWDYLVAKEITWDYRKLED